jgi:hypothetical protein
MKSLLIFDNISASTISRKSFQYGLNFPELTLFASNTPVVPTYSALKMELPSMLFLSSSSFFYFFFFFYYDLSRHR